MNLKQSSAKFMGTAPLLSTIKYWTAEFKRGRPIVVSTSDMIENIQHIVIHDWRMKVRV